MLIVRRLLLLVKFSNNVQGVKQYYVVARNITGAVTRFSVKLFNNQKHKELQK